MNRRRVRKRIPGASEGREVARRGSLFSVEATFSDEYGLDAVKKRF